MSDHRKRKMECQLKKEIKNQSLLRCAHIQSNSTDLYSRIGYLTLTSYPGLPTPLILQVKSTYRRNLTVLVRMNLHIIHVHEMLLI